MKKLYLLFFTLLFFTNSYALFDKPPKAVRSRFVIGEPVWKEMRVKKTLASDYDEAWKKLVEIIVDSGFDIGYMDKDSGYLRTNPNSGIVVLKGHWVYEVKIIVKLVVNNKKKNKEGKPKIEKLRIKVVGDLAKVKKGVLKASYHGYDKVILSNIFNDLTHVFGEN